MTKALLFDFDDTLVDFTDADTECLRQIHSMTGTSVRFEIFLDKAIENMMSFHELVDRNMVDPLTLHYYRLRNTFDELKILWDPGYIDAYKDAIVEATRAPDGIFGLLAGLRTGFRLGMLTNAYDPSLQRRRIRSSGLEQFFDDIVISGEEGTAKPDPEIFRMLSTRLGVMPEDCVFIGDSPHYDIEGANEAGMETVLVGGKDPCTNHTPDHGINDLHELWGILGGGSKSVSESLAEFTTDLRRIMGDDLVEIIIHGSYALGDFTPGLGDLDFIVLTGRDLIDAQVSRLFDLHDSYRKGSDTVLGQLEGTYYPGEFLERLTGDFTGCYIGTGRKGWSRISTFRNSFVDFRLIKEKGIFLLNSRPRLYDPAECELSIERRSALQKLRNTISDHGDIDIGFIASAVHWCARTLFQVYFDKIASKTEACSWSIRQLWLEEFKDLFQRFKDVRAPFSGQIEADAGTRCVRLLDLVRIKLDEIEGTDKTEARDTQ